MEIDTILTLPRWRILEIISQKPSSPLEISIKLQTSVAYISQQLKLLEAADIVKKAKTGEVEKGRPRFIFSITKDILHMTVLANNFSAKKVLNLDDRSKMMLKIWLVEDPLIRRALERVYWSIEKDLDNIGEILLENKNSKKPELVIVTDSEKIKSRHLSINKDSDNLVDISIVKSFDSKKDSSSFTILYNSNLSKLVKEMKGGLI